MDDLGVPGGGEVRVRVRGVAGASYFRPNWGQQDQRKKNVFPRLIIPRILHSTIFN